MMFIQISQWLNLEDTLPLELTAEPTVWEILLTILVQTAARTIVVNCLEALNMCLDAADEDVREKFAMLVWGMLPNVLSKVLIDETDRQIGLYNKKASIFI